MSDSFEKQWTKLNSMEERVRRKGFSEGNVVGRAHHEIRSLTSHVVSESAVFIAAGDKAGALHVGCLDRSTGLSLAAWRLLPPLPFKRGGERVIDVLHVVDQSAHATLIVGTRGNGAWMLPLAELIRGEDPTPVQLPFSENESVRRLLYDERSATLWAAAGTRCIAWDLTQTEPDPIVDVDLGARATAFAIDRGTGNDDHLYIATNMSTLHRLTRGANGWFTVAKGDITEASADWKGRASVIETLIPLSEVMTLDPTARTWRRRFPHRGVVATTLRHIMVLFDENDKMVCDVRRVAMHSKILAAAPVCLADWNGIAVATLDKTIRVFRPSGIRRPETEFIPYCTDAPEIETPRAILGGYEDVDFLKERVYAINVLRPPDPSSPAAIVLGMGDHRVQFHQYRVSWDVRKEAQAIAEETVSGAENIDVLLRELEWNALRPNVPSREKYAASVLVPEVGNACQTDEQWRQLELLVWDIIAGTDASPKVPVHLVQSLRRLQVSRPDKREELEQTITRIRKHIFDRDSFSAKEDDFLSLTRSTDENLEDDRVVYRSILISRRHDPLFQKSFHPEEFGEVQAFEAIPSATESPAAISPADRRFIISTYRRFLWLFDGEGNHRKIEGAAAEWGYAQAILCLPNAVVFGFSEGRILAVPRNELTQPLLADALPVEFINVAVVDASPLCFCLVPNAEGNEFLCGDSAGTIWALDGSADKELFTLSEDYSEGRRIEALQSFVAEIGGRARTFVVAGTDLGFVILFEWTDGNTPELRQISSHRAGTAGVTALLVHREGMKQVVSGCGDGNVTGWWVVEGENGDPTLSAYWSFGAAQAVRQIQRLPLNIGTGCPEDELLGIASHDEHLHVVDHAGRHLETIYLPKVKLDRFIAVPEPDNADVVEARVYACGFENQFLCFRLISRSTMLTNLGNDVNRLGREREACLTRWRAYAIREGHLRHRFVRQSERYPGSDPQSVIAEIRRLMRVSGSEEGPTGVVTALLRRLFQNRFPGETALPDPPIGLRKLFADREVYYETVRLLTELEGQWDTPGSVSNRRVQYFWIRSLLREIENIDMLRRWIEIGKDNCEVELADPENNLYHFLEHTSELVQLKVLQALERTLFGWPNIEKSGVLASASGVKLDDIEWLLRALLSRLRLSPGKIEGDQPNAVVLQIGKILCHLLRIGCVEPLYITDAMQRYNVAAAMYTVLREQCMAMARLEARACVYPGMTAGSRELAKAQWDETHRLNNAAATIDAVQKLAASVEARQSPETLVKAVETIVDLCFVVAVDRAEDDFVREAAFFYGTVQSLLSVTNLEMLVDRPVAFSRPPASRFHASHERLAKFRDIIPKFERYRMEKADDRYGRQFHALSFETFNEARTAWRELAQILRQPDDDIPELELALLSRIADAWDEIVTREQNAELLNDLVGLVHDAVVAPHAGPAANAKQAAERLAESETLTTAALRNFFVRLVLFSEATCAAMIHRPSASTRTTLRWIDLTGSGGNRLIEGADAPWPTWLDADWSSPAALASLTEESLVTTLTSLKPVDWKTLAMPAIDDARDARPLGFFMFGWSPGSAGSARFDSASLMWTLLLQSLIFKRAALQQDALRGQVFSMVAHNLGSPLFQLCSDARVLADGFLEADNENRYEKYDQILRQSRHMQGIIDAILSIDGRETKLNLRELPLAEVVYDVVRTIRPEARGWVEIDYPKPDPEMLKSTRFYTDEIRVYDILLNLVGNAVKYSPEGTVVRVKASVTSRGAELVVRDYGPGIPEEEKKSVFEPFFRGKWSIENKIQGLGLGLYVADLYARALNGRIHIANESGQGASFTVFLPRLTSDSGVAADAHSSHR